MGGDSDQGLPSVGRVEGRIVSVEPLVRAVPVVVQGRPVGGDETVVLARSCPQASWAVRGPVLSGRVVEPECSGNCQYSDC